MTGVARRRCDALPLPGEYTPFHIYVLAYVFMAGEPRLVAFVRRLKPGVVLGLVGTVILLFGLHSGAALATVVGVLVEVRVMLSLVWLANRTRHWFV